MAIVTRKEFAELCGKSTNYINTYITRNQISVIPPDGKLIDTENPLNILFKKKCKSIDRNKTEEERKVRKETKQGSSDFEKLIGKAAENLGMNQEVIDKIYTKPETPEQKRSRLEQNKKNEEEMSWDARKKKADALQAERKAELTQLQVEKMMGSLMPVDLVEAIFRINIQDIFKNFESACINLASIYCDILAGGDREKLAEITGKLRLEISQIITRTKTNAAQEIENAVAEFADTRARGERK